MNRKNESLKLVGKIFATGIMSFCGVVSETAMNVTFPALMKEFSIGTSTVQWLTTGYLLVLSLVITLSSYLKRNFTPRLLFFIAICSFIAGTLLCYTAPSFMLLLSGRCLQGLGTGVALPLMFNIILAEAPREKLGVFMGVGSIITALAPAVGPVWGGYIVDALGWRVIFLTLLPLLLLSFVLGAVLIKRSTVDTHSHFHASEYFLIALGYIAFIVATVLASECGWLSWEVLALLAIAVVSLGLFLKKSSRSASPLLNVAVLKNRQFTLGLTVIIAIQFSVLALGYVIPNYSQLVNHTKAFTAGVLLVPGCLVGAVLSLIAGWLLDHFGAFRPIITGSMFLVHSLALFTYFGVELNIMQFYGFYVLFTIGQGLCVGNTMTYGLSKLSPDLSADGNALITSTQQLAGAAGTAVAATIVASAQNADMAHLEQSTALGSRDVFLALTIILVLALVCARWMFVHPRKG
jgi:EmrB/QacA subfamily drug resistance transporter